MYYEMTGTVVEKIVTLMVCENGDVKVYEKETNVTILNFLPSILKNSSHTNSESMEKEVNELLKEKFLCQNKFTSDIEQLVLTTELNYIEAIISYCEEKILSLNQ